MNKIDYSLMLVSDYRIKDNHKFLNIIESALISGATMIQLREKDVDTSFFYNRAFLVKKLCNKFKVPLIINDRLDIALAVNADGLHIGQKDIKYEIARSHLGANKIIGISISNINELYIANNTGANYIGLSPIFSTITKTDHLANPLGIEGLRLITKISNKPIISIGGINKSNVSKVICNGSDGVAVISAISESRDPEKETKILIQKINRAKIEVQNNT